MRNANDFPTMRRRAEQAGYKSTGTMTSARPSSSQRVILSPILTLFLLRWYARGHTDNPRVVYLRKCILTWPADDYDRVLAATDDPRIISPRLSARVVRLFSFFPALCCQPATFSRILESKTNVQACRPVCKNINLRKVPAFLFRYQLPRHLIHRLDQLQIGRYKAESSAADKYVDSKAYVRFIHAAIFNLPTTINSSPFYGSVTLISRTMVVRYAYFISSPPLLFPPRRNEFHAISQGLLLQLVDDRDCSLFT